MRTLWRDKWIETPRPHRVPGGLLIEVEATAPIASHGAASGRRFDSPLRKLASFTLTDGPTATARKARSKRAEPAYTGDYHLVAILGTVDGGERDGERVLALAPRSPSCASWMLVAEALIRPVGPEFGPEEFTAAAASLAADARRLSQLVRQSYLYSATPPPAELTASLDRALTAPGRTQHKPGVISAADGGPGAPGETISLPPSAIPAPAAPPLAILGAGDYVRIEVAPAFAEANLQRAVLCDREPQIAALAAAELGFAAATTDPEAAIASLERRGLVVVATAHDSHAALAARALEAGHRVLCEKPAVVTAADLDLLTAAAEAAPGELEVGFNRRHNPIVERARSLLAAESGPTTLVATIREVDIEPDHWYLWPNQGTRVAGNLCHWIDLALHLIGPGPEPVSVSVSPRVSTEPTGIDAERSFSVAFDDGSAATFVPTGRGDSVRGVQEGIEARRGPLTVVVDDLWKLRALRSGRPIRRRTLWRDKGHGAMYAEALRRFAAGEPAGYPAADVRRVGEVQIAATELILAGVPGGEIPELVERSRERSA